MRGIRYAGAMTAGMVMLAGCTVGDADTEPERPQRSASAQAGSRWISCESARSSPPARAGGQRTDVLGPPRLDEGFVAVAAVVCAEDADRRPDGSVLKVLTESRADDVAALVKALRVPDEPLSDALCQQDNRMVYEWLALLDQQGNWVHPGLPRDACGQPLRQVHSAVRGLKATQTSRRTMQDPNWAEAIEAGCDRQEQDDTWVIGVRFDDLEPSEVRLPRGGTARLCVYRVPHSEQRTAAGELADGGTLTPDRWAAIKEAAPAAGPEQPCTTPASRFAVLATTDDARRVHVELDGCHRVWAGAMRQATPELLALLG